MLTLRIPLDCGYFNKISAGESKNIYIYIYIQDQIRNKLTQTPRTDLKRQNKGKQMRFYSPGEKIFVKTNGEMVTSSQNFTGNTST